MHIAGSFSDFIAGRWWDWGSVPAWVGSILTSVSVFLAISILRSDRKRASRASAESLATYTEVDFRDNQLVFHSYNAGDKPIPYAAVLYRGESRQESVLFRTDDGRATLEPASKATAKIPYDFMQPRRHIYIQVVDAHGRVWFRTDDSRKYVTARATNFRYRKSRKERRADKKQLTVTRKKAKAIKQTLPKKHF